MGTHMKVLGESFPMNTNMAGLRWFSKIVLWMKVVSALEGLNPTWAFCSMKISILHNVTEKL